MFFVLFFWRPDRDRLDWEIWVAFCVIFLAAGPVQHAIGFGIPPACLVARGTGTRSPELLGDSQAPGGHFSEASLLGMPKLLGRPPCSWLWHPSSMLGRQRYRYKVARAPGGFPSSWRTLFGGRSAGDAKAPLELDWRPNHPVSPYSSLYWCPAAGSGPFW